MQGKVEEEDLKKKAQPFMDRDAKIAALRQKKVIENVLKDLRSYRDEETRRHFYLENLKLSIVDSFDQIQLLNQELELVSHMEEMKRNGTLPPPSTKDDPITPLKSFHIPKGAFDEMHMMMARFKEAQQQPQLQQPQVVQGYAPPKK